MSFFDMFKKKNIKSKPESPILKVEKIEEVKKVIIEDIVKPYLPENVTIHNIAIKKPTDVPIMAINFFKATDSTNTQYVVISLDDVYISITSIASVIGNTIEAIDSKKLIFKEEYKKAYPPIPDLSLCVFLIDSRILLQDKIAVKVSEDGSWIVLPKEHILSWYKDKEVISITDINNLEKMDLSYKNLTSSFHYKNNPKFSKVCAGDFDIKFFDKTSIALFRLKSEEEVCDALPLLVEIVKEDPMLTSMILKLCSSAAYAHRYENIDVDKAINNVLGYEMAMNMALATALHGSMNIEFLDSNKKEQYISKALMVAHVAEIIPKAYTEYANVSTSAAYTAGILHNLGVVIISSILEDKTKVYNQACVSNIHLDSSAVDEKLIGLTKEDLASMLISSFGVSPYICEALFYYKCPSKASDDYSKQIAEIINLANGILEKDHSLSYNVFNPKENIIYKYPDVFNIDLIKSTLKNLEVKKENILNTLK